MTYDTSARTVRPASHHRGAPPASSGSTEQASRDGRPLVLVYGAHRDFRARAALAFLDALGARAVHACGPRGESLGPAHPARLVMAELALDLAHTPRAVVSVLPERWDYLVTFREAALPAALTPTGHGGHVVRWVCADPALFAGTRAHLVEAYRSARDDVRLLVADFLVALEGRGERL